MPRHAWLPFTFAIADKGLKGAIRCCLRGVRSATPRRVARKGPRHVPAPTSPRFPNATVTEVAKVETRRVLEGLPGRQTENGVLVGDLGLVEVVLYRQHGGSGRPQHGVEPAQHGPRQDHVTIFAAHVGIVQIIAGHAPV